MRPKYHRWTDGDLEAIRRHYGRTAPEPVKARILARQLGVSYGALCKIARYYGLVERRPRPPAGDCRRALELYRGGLSAADAGRAAGVSVSTVLRLVRAAGCVRPPGYALTPAGLERIRNGYRWRKENSRA